MEMTVTKYNKYETANGDLITSDFSGLCKMFEKPKAEFSFTLADVKADEKVKALMDARKHACGGVAWGENKDGKRGNKYVVNRCAISLDYDDLATCADGTEHPIYAKIKGFLGEHNYLMYSTTKHDKNSPRLRIIIPTNRSMSAEEYTPVARQCYKLIGWEGADPCGWSPAQMMGFTCHLKNSEYVFRARTDGKYFDVDAFLQEQEIDVNDEKTWAFSPAEQAKIKSVKAKIKAVKQSHGNNNGNNKTARANLDIANICSNFSGSRVANAFNKTYSISAAIDKYVPDFYTLESTNGNEARYTLTGSSSKAGLRVTDDALAYSYHSHDPLADGHFHNAFDLVRVHLYGDLDTAGEYKRDYKRPSFSAMKKLCESDKSVVANMYNVDSQEIKHAYIKVSEETAKFAARRACDGAYTGDNALAKGLEILAADRYVYAVDAACWYRWDGNRWTEEKDVNVASLCDELRAAIGLLATAEGDTNNDINMEMVNTNLKALDKYRTRNNALAMLRTAIAVRKADMDANDMLVPMNNGYTIDLSKDEGTIRKSEPADMMTKCVNAYIDDTDDDFCSEFDDYIADMFVDEDVRDYEQRVAGYSLTGLKSEKKFFVNWGPRGNNGKSTHLEFLKDVYGDFAVTVNSNLLLSNRFGNSDSEAPSPVLAEVAGARVVMCDEVGKGRKFDTATIKQLTGGAAIRARKLRQDSFEFVPRFKVMLAVNDVPELQDAGDSALRLRIRIIPFDAAFSAKDGDRTIDYDIEKKIHSGEWKRACLRWMVDGYRLYNAVRLDDYDGGSSVMKSSLPTRMASILSDYITDSDEYQNFFESFYDYAMPGSYVTVSEMFDVYSKEFRGKDEYSIFVKRLAKFMREAGFESGRRMIRDENANVRKATVWFGIRRLGYGSFEERQHDSSQIGEKICA